MYGVFLQQEQKQAQRNWCWLVDGGGGGDDVGGDDDGEHSSMKCTLFDFGRQMSKYLSRRT